MQFRRQTSRDGRNATANGPAIARLNTGYALKVALVYQDALTQQWAGQVRDHMAGVVGQAAIHCTEWKISDLGERRAYLEGAAALAQADVIVVSLHETERLPAIFYLWVNLWLQQRSELPGALVALVVPLEELNPAAKNETRWYWAAVASEGRLEFFMQECKQPGEPIAELREDIMRWAKAA
jgi:hypothetical protein